MQMTIIFSHTTTTAESNAVMARVTKLLHEYSRRRQEGQKANGNEVVKEHLSTVKDNR